MFNKLETNALGSKTNNLFSSEPFWVIALLLVFLSLGLIEASKLPLFLDTWWDEIMHVDPAANLYFGQGFRSSAWFAQSKDEFWAGYPPLYPFLLSLWMQIFGFSLSAARSLNYMLAALSALILWKAVIRLNLVKLAACRILLLTLLLVIVGYSFDFRPGRPDVLMTTLAVTAFLAYSIPVKRYRYLCLVCLCAIFPFAGIGLIAYTAIFNGLVFIYLKRSFFKEFLAILSGLVIGSLGLLSFYYTNGVFRGFLASTLTTSTLSMPGSKGPFLDKFLSDIFFGLTSGYRSKWLLIFILLIAVYNLAKKEFKYQSLASFGIAAGFSIPFAMRTAGAYPLYYDWMTCLPLAVCVCSEMSELLRAYRQHYLRSALLALTMALLLFAPPLHLKLLMTHWGSLDYAVVDNFVTQNVHKDDWAAGDPLTYYALRNKVEIVFHPFYIQAMSQQEKDRVSVIITKPTSDPPLQWIGDFETITSKLGGFWYDTGKSLTLRGAKSPFSPKQVELRIYRRRS